MVEIIKVYLIVLYKFKVFNSNGFNDKHFLKEKVINKEPLASS